MRDSYRKAHPDPVQEPGHTWSPVHAEHEGGSGRSEHQDRIDFILHRGLKVLVSRTYISGSPCPWPDVADNDWPSDHAAVIPPSCRTRPTGLSEHRNPLGRTGRPVYHRCHDLATLIQ